MPKEAMSEKAVSEKIEKVWLEAFSRGEVTRREIEERTGQDISFGRLLGQLHEHHLPLPRVPSDPHAPGFQLIKRLAERAGSRVG
jgi:hypothetical protein